MDVDERLAFIMREPTEEVVTADELRTLIETKTHPKHYIGLEISGVLHVGSLVMTGFKINDFMKAGITTTVFLADWHTYINDKMGGDWDKIKKVSQYYTDAFKFFCPGVNIVLGSDLYNGTKDYWENFVHFSKHMTLARTMRSLTIMGRNEAEKNLDLSQLLYPPMQSVDIKALDLDIVHAGMDQRKIHMLVREIFPKLGWKVPVLVHHHLLPGMTEPLRINVDEGGDGEDVRISSKMSKSKPASGILIHDDEKAIRNKISKAFCPVEVTVGNPVLELVRYVVFHEFDEFVIERPSKYGGSITYTSYKDIEHDFVTKKIHPMDLKSSTATYINRIIDPIREHFKGRELQLS